MGTRERHAPGTFSWVELATSDPEAAKAFYAGVLGWSYDDTPIGEGAVYSMASVGGHHVAALFGSDQPPHWNSYVTVASADDAARRAVEAGGEVVAEPFDVMDAGRMSVVRDPTGALISVWQPRGSIGARLVNAPGALTWNDLMTTDVGRAAEFYGALFGWELVPVPGAPGDRVGIRNGDRANGGMARLPEGSGAPPHWLPYFVVDDVHAAVERVDRGGGRLLAGPIPVPTGLFAIFSDPQGAAFGALAGELDD